MITQKNILLDIVEEYPEMEVAFHEYDVVECKTENKFSEN